MNFNKYINLFNKKPYKALLTNKIFKKHLVLINKMKLIKIKV